MSSLDLSFENNLTFFLVRPLTVQGEEWLRETAPEDAQFIGKAMYVEGGYVDGVREAALEAGLDV